MRRNTLVAAIATTLFSAAALAHGGMGPQGHGPGYGMHGHGHGMMQGQGPGPGMGHGMMQRGGGPGMGGGACMESADMASLGLSAEQRDKIATIQKELSTKQLDLMAKMRDLRTEAFRSGETATGKNSEAAADIRKQMFEVTRQGRERVDGVLTPEQRAQWRPGWRGAPYRG